MKFRPDSSIEVRPFYNPLVKRIVGKSDIYDLKIQLDVNVEIYPMETDKVRKNDLTPQGLLLQSC